MILAKGVECILCNINGVSNILIGQGRIDEMVVVARKEYAALDHLGDPLLMKHEGIVIGKAQIEQRRLAGDYKMEAAAAALRPSPTLRPFSRKMAGVLSFFILLMQAIPAANGIALSQ